MDILEPFTQGFPTCGTRTTGGTQTWPRWYTERFQSKTLAMKICFKRKKDNFFIFITKIMT
jgi:hypothetical protein